MDAWTPSMWSWVVDTADLMVFIVLCFRLSLYKLVKNSKKCFTVKRDPPSVQYTSWPIAFKHSDRQHLCLCSIQRPTVGSFSWNSLCSLSTPDIFQAASRSYPVTISGLGELSEVLGLWVESGESLSVVPAVLGTTSTPALSVPAMPCPFLLSCDTCQSVKMGEKHTPSSWSRSAVEHLFLSLLGMVSNSWISPAEYWDV